MRKFASAQALANPSQAPQILITALQPSIRHPLRDLKRHDVSVHPFHSDLAAEDVDEEHGSQKPSTGSSTTAFDDKK